MARVLLLGATGLAGLAIAHELRSRGHVVSAPSRDEWDLSRQPPTPQRLGWAEVVVNAAVVKDAGRPESRPVNVELPLGLAALCRAEGRRLIHLSSDAVLAACPPPRTEGSAKAPPPQDTYARQKAEGEPDSGLVLRTSLIGPEGRSPAGGLLCWVLASQGRCRGFTDHLWNGLTSLELARVIAERIAGDWVEGIRHLHSDTVTKADLLVLIARAYGLAAEPEAVASGAPRDQRLATAFADGIRPPLAEQIARLPGVSDVQGRWTGVGPGPGA